MAGKRSAVYGAVYDPRGGSAKQVSIELSGPQALGLRDKSGYAPEQLDPVIQTLIDNAGSGAELLRQYTPLLGALMNRLQDEVSTMLTNPPTDNLEALAAIGRVTSTVDLAGKISIIIERLSKMTMNSVKSKDDATRLRTFLATGDEEGRAGLEGLGENQLRRIVTEAAQGWVKTDPDEKLN